MPFRRQTTNSFVRPAYYDQLRNQLKDEWSNPRNDPNAQPSIIENVEQGLGNTFQWPGNTALGSGNTIKIYVVWDAWGDLTQIQRSEMIMDVYEELHGLQQSTRVTVAMGVTTAEATRLGIAS